jgi:hypothetical protein
MYALIEQKNLLQNNGLSNQHDIHLGKQCSCLALQQEQLVGGCPESCNASLCHSENKMTRGTEEQDSMYMLLSLHVYTVFILYLFLELLGFFLTDGYFADNLTHLWLSHLKLQPETRSRMTNSISDT